MYAAEAKTTLFDGLKQGQPPAFGDYDETVWSKAKELGKPQMGTTNYRPDALLFEFIFPDPLGTPTILSVKVDPPERIVFMPVPDWVVETVWEGEVDGSYRFESEAHALVRAFEEELTASNNPRWFEKRLPKTRQ